MNVLIIGGSKAADSLLGLLDLKKYEVKVIDQRLDICERIANEYGVDVFFGDGTDLAVLRRAGCGDMDVLLALTGKDENNLVCCQLAKHSFHVPLTIANVNNPRNTESLKKLGVDKTFSGTEILANLLEEEIEYKGLMTAYNIPETDRAIVEFILDPSADACGRTIAEYEFPENMTIVLITRQSGEVLTPAGHVRMDAADRILLVCNQSEYADVWRTFVAPHGAGDEHHVRGQRL